ncbi:MAG: hypothetical protein ACI9E1_001865, partial [Cryomorphaceae bacterium]
SIREFVYETEYEPGEVYPNTTENTVSPTPKTIPTILPPTPTAFEIRNMGSTLEIEAILGKNEKIIIITFKPEVVKHVADNVLTQWVTEFAKVDVRMPIFYTLRMNTVLTVLDGEFTLAGTHSPEVDGKPDESRKLLVFVKASVLKLGK